VLAKFVDRLLGAHALERLPDLVVVAVDVAVLAEDGLASFRPRRLVVLGNVDLPPQRDVHVVVRPVVVVQCFPVDVDALGEFARGLDRADTPGVAERGRPQDGRPRLPAAPRRDRRLDGLRRDRQVLDRVELAVEGDGPLAQEPRDQFQVLAQSRCPLVPRDTESLELLVAPAK